MTTGRRRLAAIASAVLALGGCGRARAMAETRDELELAGYRQVQVSLHAGAGLGVARIRAAADEAPPPDQAAKVAWTTLPVRFDQLVVSLGDQSTSFTYEELADRFGPRRRALDARQVDDEVVRSGLKLMLVLSAAAMLSVGAVVVTGGLALRTVRRARAGGASSPPPAPPAPGSPPAR